jgi:hypothetical protein
MACTNSLVLLAQVCIVVSFLTKIVAYPILATLVHGTILDEGMSDGDVKVEEYLIGGTLEVTEGVYKFQNISLKIVQTPKGMGKTRKGCFWMYFAPQNESEVHLL